MRRALATTVIQKILALSRRRQILDSAAAPKPSSSSTHSLESLGFRLFRTVCRAAVLVVSSGCVANTLFTVIGYPACVVGGSMRPALNESPQSRQSSSADSSVLSWLQLKVNWVFVNCWKARRYEFQRGEIVVFVSPKDPYDFVIKRLVGLEGDEIVHSDYSPEKPVTITRGLCWVEGDNRDNSIDSNSAYGPISTGLIFGKATHVIWPPEEWRKLDPTLPKNGGRVVESLDGGNHIRIVNKSKKLQ